MTYYDNVRLSEINRDKAEHSDLDLLLPGYSARENRRKALLKDSPHIQFALKRIYDYAVISPKEITVPFEKLGLAEEVLEAIDAEKIIAYLKKENCISSGDVYVNSSGIYFFKAKNLKPTNIKRLLLQFPDTAASKTKSSRKVAKYLELELHSNTYLCRPGVTPSDKNCYHFKRNSSDRLKCLNTLIKKKRYVSSQELSVLTGSTKVKVVKNMKKMFSGIAKSLNIKNKQRLCIGEGKYKLTCKIKVVSD